MHHILSPARCDPGQLPDTPQSRVLSATTGTEIPPRTSTGHAVRAPRVPAAAGTASPQPSPSASATCSTLGDQRLCQAPLDSQSRFIPTKALTGVRLRLPTFAGEETEQKASGTSGACCSPRSPSPSAGKLLPVALCASHPPTPTSRHEHSGPGTAASSLFLESP